LDGVDQIVDSLAGQLEEVYRKLQQLVEKMSGN
jgi:hypothetical protein